MTIQLAPEPLISFIVPIYKLPKDELQRCLGSLLDQDYPNMEVICVMDGPDVNLLNVAVDFLKDKRFKVIEMEHGGACAARNAGFKASAGEIVSFFNSDYIAKPGMVRMWVNELQKHPECGFIYGGYEWGTSHRNAYPSQPFDEWLLTQANYIDCGFPLWRKYVVDWDPNCKSLQDWDFWLRVIKTHGVKGNFLGREISYIAAPPKPGGLSFDSHGNWVERVKYVREKNDIPTNDMVVTSLGAPHHGKSIAQMIGADFRDGTILKPNQYKALYMIGFYMKPSDVHNQHAQILGFYKDSVKIVHFVGADIYWLKRFSHADLKTLAGALTLQCDHILCETEHAKRELAEMGIQADIVAIPPYQDYEITPLPEKFKVAIFLTNHSDFDKYCREDTLSIVRAMPDVQFTAYGDYGKDEIYYPNMTHVGNIWGDAWKQFVYDHSCYLRIVRHDTRPMASDEFILAGRDVVTNIPLPYQRYVSTAGDQNKNEQDFFGTGLNAHYWPKTKKKIVQMIREVRKHSNQKKDIAQMAREEYSAILDREKYIKTIKGFCVEKELAHVA
jgi:glycosyltransferase involved in cell wall biosynthesis